MVDSKLKLGLINYKYNIFILHLLNVIKLFDIIYFL